MSKKKKFLSGIGVLILAGGVSAVVSVPSSAGQSKPGTARAAQATPDISGYQSQLNSGVVGYFHAVAANGVHWSSLNASTVNKDKVVGAVRAKLNKVGQKGDRGAAGPAGSDDRKGDHSSADPRRDDDQKGEHSSADPSGEDDQKGDTDSADPAGSDDQKGEHSSADRSGEDDQNGDTGSAGSDG